MNARMVSFSVAISVGLSQFLLVIPDGIAAGRPVRSIASTKPPEHGASRQEVGGTPSKHVLKVAQATPDKTDDSDPVPDTAVDEKEASPGSADEDVSLDLGKDLLGLKKPDKQESRFHGFLMQESAYTYADVAHWSRAAFRAQVSTNGQWSDQIRWKATIRGEVDPVYAWTDFYPDPVRHDQRADALIGETYIDTAVKGLDLRIGRQNIVWGEMVGLFFADVVTAKDLRSFVLPAFELIRIPQWAVRGESFIGDSHLEMVWVPYTSFDNIGKPEAEFFPLRIVPTPGVVQQVRGEEIPSRSLSHSNFGFRGSTLNGGWDLSAFFYSSMDTGATFYRDVVPGPTTTITYTPRHDRINQFGGTLGKDLGSSVLKAEAVVTTGRSFSVTRLSAPNGLVRSKTLDFAVGLDFPFEDESRLNLQFFQRAFFSHDQDMLQDRFESGGTLLYNRKINAKIEAEFLMIQSLNRWENLLRPKVVWKVQSNLRLTAGIDVFNGPSTGAIGRFRDRDRIYVETRYDF
ncbi:MAG: hypothetical protein IPK20_03275 [Betaproteobacteria bacterium]|nr:hypothetical protein [Betaproteobacteria bacterium]